MDPWPPAGPEQRQTMAAHLAAWRGAAGRAVARALRRQVRPGSQVAVAGAGVGLLALHLARATLRAARRVHILEGDPFSKIGRVLAAAPGLGGRVRFLSPTGGKLSAPVDLIVLGAGRGTPVWALPLWAAAAWARCGGPTTRVFPPWLDITMAPTRDPILHGATAAFWRRGVAGVRFESAAGALLQAPILTRAARLDWLAPPVTARYPLAGLARLQVNALFRITREGDLTGFALLASEAAGTPGLAAPHGQGVLLPLPEPTPVRRGSVVRADVVWWPGPMGGAWEWRWAVQVADGAWKRGRRTHGTARTTGKEPAEAQWGSEGERRGGPGEADPGPRARRGTVPGRSGGSARLPSVPPRLSAGRGRGRDLRSGPGPRQRPGSGQGPGS